MNRDYEEIIENVPIRFQHFDRDKWDIVLTHAKRMADRILQLENALDEANRQLEEILREATE